MLLFLQILQIVKIALVQWVFCRRKPSVSEGSGITSDIVTNNGGFPSFYKIKSRNKKCKEMLC